MNLVCVFPHLRRSASCGGGDDKSDWNCGEIEWCGYGFTVWHIVVLQFDRAGESVGIGHGGVEISEPTNIYFSDILEHHNGGGWTESMSSEGTGNQGTEGETDMESEVEGCWGMV